MKKNLFRLLLLMACVSFIAFATLEASPTKIGRLWELILDPSSSNHTSDWKAAINWMKNNFDEHNIPIISTAKLTNSGTSQITGLDSAYKYHPLETQTRAFAWRAFWGGDPSSNLPLMIYFPWYQLNDGALGKAGPGAANSFKAVKESIDKAEADQVITAVTPLVVKSTMKDGSIEGTVSFTVKELAGSPVQVQILLVEGYHKYSKGSTSEETYFTVRASSSGAGNLGGYAILLPAKNSKYNQSFKFPVDKSWNSKYLYVVAIVEYHSFSKRVCLDVAVDRVVDVKDAASAQPIKLDLSLNNDNDKFKKVEPGSTTVIPYKVTNPTNKIIRAIVYIDNNTSVYDDWNVTKSKDTITIAPGGNSAFTISAKAPNVGAVAALDVVVLPIGTEANENPLFSNQLTVIATKPTRVVGLMNIKFADFATFKNGMMSNSYYENMAIIPDIYHAVVPPDAFDGYIFSKTTPMQIGLFRPDYGQNSNIVVNGNYSKEYGDKNNCIMAEYLKSSELNFLNSIIEKKKHLALFIDKSVGYASSVATTEEKAAYSTLFDYFGVGGGTESVKIATNDGSVSATVFNVNGVITDPLGRVPEKQEAIKCEINTTNIITTNSLYSVNWNIANTTKTTKVFYYDQDPTSNAIVKATSGNSKLLLGGFGFGGLTAVSFPSISQVLENITTWWFGYKPKLKPEIYIENTNYDFGKLQVGFDSTTKTIVIKNKATLAENVLKIFNVEFIGNADTTFTVLYKPTEIPAGKEDSIVVKIKPNTARAYNTCMNVYSNDLVNSPYPLYFNGEGEAPPAPPEPIIFIDENDLFHNFGSLSLNATPKVKYIKIYNGGTKALEIYSVKLTDNTNKTVYELQGIPDGTTIAPSYGEEKELEIWFKPVVAGEFEGSLEVKSNCSKNPTIVIEFTGKVTSSIEDEIAKIFSCTVLPNPATELISVDFNVTGELNRKVEMNIIDQTGRNVKRITPELYSPGNYIKTINVKDLPIGSYYLEYIIDNLKSSKNIKIVR